MAYTPPQTFVAGTALEAADILDNCDSLRIYLHEDVLSTDLQATRWVQTRHIQPPQVDPYSGLQHGVTGFQGGQMGGGNLSRLTFATRFLTGNAIAGVVPSTWQPIPTTSFRVNIRRSCTIIFHYWMDIESGPDTATGVPYGIASDDRIYYITPYISNTSAPLKVIGQVGVNSIDGFTATYPLGADVQYTMNRGWQQRDGSYLYSATAGTNVTVGLCSYSQIDRVALINWSIALEVFYL